MKCACNLAIDIQKSNIIYIEVTNKESCKELDQKSDVAT